MSIIQTVFVSLLLPTGCSDEGLVLRLGDIPKQVQKLCCKNTGTYCVYGRFISCDESAWFHRLRPARHAPPRTAMRSLRATTDARRRLSRTPGLCCLVRRGGGGGCIPRHGAARPPSLSIRVCSCLCPQLGRAGSGPFRACACACGP